MFFEEMRDRTMYLPEIKDHSCPLHFHRSTEILYVLTGEKQASVDGKDYLLRAGDLLLCPPFCLHVYSPSNSSAQFVCTFLPTFEKNFELYCERKKPTTHVLHDEAGKCKELLFFLRTAKNNLTVIGIANLLFGFFMDKIPFIEKKKSQPSEIAKIIAYVDEHFAEPISLGILSKEFNYSPSYFSSLFKKYFRMNIPEYVNGVRVRKSLGLLPTHKISQIYWLCGFQSPQQYFLNFRKYFGCTPKEYMTKK